MKPHKFSDLPITNKLRRLQAMTLSLALALTLLISSITHLWHHHQELLIDVDSTGNMIGFNASAALLFDDKQSATDILSALRNKPDIIGAQLYTIAGAPFAHYSATDNFNDFPSLLLDAENHLQQHSIMLLTHIVILPIHHKDDTVGYLYLQIDLGPMWWGLFNELGQILLAMLAAFIVSGWYGQRLATLISAPLISLSLLAQQVSRDKNYTVRALDESEDEIGQLVKSFNQMIKQVQERDKVLGNQRDHLETEVEARTLALRQAVIEAQASNVAKSQFLANMSHEIRTPMNGVLGMTELLINTELTNRQKRLAETAYRSAESLLGIINNILDFSKIEASKFQLNINDFDLRALLEETTEMLASQAHHKKLELILNLPVDLNDIVSGDADRLRQVLINLIGNGIKFTHTGEVHLKVSYLPPNQAQYSHLLFEVIDTGGGIPTEQQDAIFESFTQVDGSITRRHGGTGLGLAISKELVELMGGQLEVSSTVGQGSRFYFSLELERSNQKDLIKADISALQGINILVVDDNANSRNILCNQLSYWGVICDCVASGAQALDHLQAAQQQNKPYRLILIDWDITAMDALTLSKTIKNNRDLSTIPMVMLSSDNINIDGDKEQDYGISFVLTKPIIQQKLLDCLLEILGRISIQTQSAPGFVASQETEATGTILIAEDQEINQEVAMYMLQAIGYQVEIANNGLEAVNASAAKHYDLILMDCHMPVMDGLEATKAIRAREQASAEKSRTPIIALTAEIQKGIVEQCVDAGMDGYLSKPFNKMQLQKVLHKWLKQNQTTPIVPACDVNPNPQLNASYISERRSVVLNPLALENLRQITTTTGETLLNNAIKMFLLSAPEALQAIKTEFTNQDSEALRKTAHSFKSVCANLGAQDLADCCGSIEHIAKQGDINGVADLLSTMEINLPKVITALTREFDSNAFGRLTNDHPELQPELNGKRILLIDDDSVFRLLTSAALKASGFAVDEAVSGNQALEQIIQQTPDLILLDAVMDGLDGFETCRLIRSAANMADVPIIMSTGLGDINSINRAFEAGANDFVIKPLNYPILIHRLWFILRASLNTAELRSSKLQLSAAQRIARLGYWTWDSKHNQFQISEHLANLCGINLQLFNNTLEGFIDLIHADDQESVRNIITAARNNATIQHAEYRLQVNHSSPIVVHQEIEAINENNHSIITGTVQDITHKKQTELQIHRLAYFDNLTGLASRAYYHERIEDFINTANRRNERFAFLFLDLDGFKDINDSFGHDVGDHFLKAIAERLRLVVRDIDFAARLGGDEFCIILDNIANEEEVAEVADRCLQKINQPLQLNQHQIKPRVSIGIALYPRDGSNEVELMKAADAAMYAAKLAGKQRFVFYSEDMASQAITRLEKEQMLRDAFEQQQFILHYQPQISMQTGRMIGMEALIRWQHPEQGMIPPSDFIPLAEQLGLITDLGNWVLESVCQQILQWHDTGLPFMQVAVNIAPAHFHDPGLFSTVKELLAKTGIPAQYLELEVTESAMQTEGSLSVFNQLRELGVKIAIDDFGTGYSCLASLKQLPLDCLKVDKVFVDDVLTNPHTALLLGTIIGLANALDYTLVAEGVETKEQALVMHGLGCHIIQGYLFSRPVPSDQIPALLSVDFTIPKKIA